MPVYMYFFESPLICLVENKHRHEKGHLEHLHVPFAQESTPQRNDFTQTSQSQKLGLRKGSGKGHDENTPINECGCPLV